MPPFRQQKQRHSAISDEVKCQICEWGKANKNKRHVDIANYFNEVYPNLTIDRSTISKILLQSDKWTAIINTEDSTKIFAQAFNLQENELVFSNGWLYKFKQRNNIRRYHIHGESESAPLASLPEERTKLQQLLS
ncbi:DNA-binding centromere protein B [Rhizophagus irregularis DAOM 181602=DAOM 197198]|nr:DNA-binding centromere protein B [Rhizophagus irregularis DAOM 181602=DAOM 197198]CAG8571468.1 8330_t:CDS:2 [Rhizophagus irregularis]